MEVQQSIRDLIENILLLQQKATPMERQILRDTTELLELCVAAQPQPCIIELLRVEIGQQKCWIKDYLNQQKSIGEVTCFFDGLTKAPEDYEILLLRYCQETLEGARTIALVLGVAPLRSAWKIRHHRKSATCPYGQSHAKGTDNNSAPMPSSFSTDHSQGDSLALERFRKHYWYY
jgi:hypothetical protein